MTKREDSKKQFNHSNKPKKEKIKYNLTEDVQLHKAENAWEPSHIKVPEPMNDQASLLKNFHSLLNKITEENFEQLVNDINDDPKYLIDSTEKLSAVVYLFIEKSIFDPVYVSTCAKLCKVMSTVHLFDDTIIASTKNTNLWKTYLIDHCQREFERSKYDNIFLKLIKDCINIYIGLNNANDKEEIEKMEYDYFKIRQRGNGMMIFLGELYKMNMLTTKIMIGCIDALIKSVTEENIERLCKLLTTIGEKLENELKNTNDMDLYMQELAKLINSSVITTQRIKFDILNVIDLRAAKWKPRENARLFERKPQKFQDLQEQEAKKERQYLNNRNPRRKMKFSKGQK